MNYLHFIPHVNRIDLTSIALNSVRNLWSSTVIIDNSEQSEFSQFSSQKNQFHIITPPVPLNTAQTLNFIRKIAIEKQLDFITFMHNDCEVLTDNGDLMMLDCASTVFKENNEIGFIKYNNMINGTASNDDLFCAFKTEMLIDVGSWDWICFPYYFLDTDYFQRMTNKGWKTFTIDNLECKHHSDSNTTVKNDVIRKISNPYFYVASNQLMDIKWKDYNGDWNNLSNE